MRQSDLQERSVVLVRATGFRLTLWTDAALLAVTGAPWGRPQSALAAPDWPTGLTATALDHDTVSLTWSHSDEDNVDHYRILRRSSDESRLSQIATTRAASFQDDGLQPETKYTCCVKAVGSEGAVSGRSIRSQTTTAAAPTITPVTPTPEPTPEHVQAQENKNDEQGQNATPRSNHTVAPTNLRATEITITSIKFEWAAPTDSAVTHTFIKYTVLGNSTEQTYADVRTSYTVVNLTQNTPVYFELAWATGSGINSRSSFTTLQDISTRSTGFTDTTVSASTAYTYRDTIKYLPSGESSPSNGNDVDLDVTTPALSDVGAPINFKVTNATLTDGVYVLANHDDDPILDWEYTPITITITETDDGYTLYGPYSYQGYDETGFKFTRKWIDSDATCGANCPWLLVALNRSAGHTHFTDDLIAPGTYTFRIRALNENKNPGAAAEITLRGQPARYGQ